MPDSPTGHGSRPVDADAWRAKLLEVLGQDVADGPGERSQGPEAGGRTEVLAVEAAGETYGLEIGTVAEILLMRPLTPVPRTPPFVLGIASLRGAVLPVLDLALRLGLPPGPGARSNRIVVVRDRDEGVGFRVDRVRGVVGVTPETERSGDYVQSVDPRFLQGIGYDRDGALVALLSAEALCDFEVGAP